MSKPSDDLSALFRSLRPDESVFQENASSGARDAQQRWPLFKAVAAQKPQDAPALTEQERQRWVSQEKPAAGPRKPALSLPGLSDQMSKGLGKMSGQVVKNASAVKPATRQESEKFVVERGTDQPLTQPLETAQAAQPELPPQENALVKRGSTAAKLSSAATAVRDRDGLGVFGKNSSAPVLVPTPAPVVVAERDLPAAGRRDSSLKSIFSRLEAKPEVASAVEPAVKRSSFLDRLGKR